MDRFDLIFFSSAFEGPIHRLLKSQDVRIDGFLIGYLDLNPPWSTRKIFLRSC
jgi:hypothetical protein